MCILREGSLIDMTPTWDGDSSDVYPYWETLQMFAHRYLLVEKCSFSLQEDNGNV